MQRLLKHRIAPIGSCSEIVRPRLCISTSQDITHLISHWIYHATNSFLLTTFECLQITTIITFKDFWSQTQNRNALAQNKHHWTPWVFWCSDPTICDSFSSMGRWRSHFTEVAKWGRPTNARISEDRQVLRPGCQRWMGLCCEYLKSIAAMESWL